MRTWTSRATLGITAVALLIAVTVLVACDRTPSAPRAATPAMVHDALAAHGVVVLTPEARQQLAALRAATAPYHEIETAVAAGFTKITGCLSDPVKGGMGVHYGLVSRFDATPEFNAPELLVYEPEKNGKLRLVAIEFAVPFDAWTSEEPPVLFGQTFHQNFTFGLWVLHAWIWKDNPSGLFTDYNPQATCANANE
jgi:hypothetical protein